MAGSGAHPARILLVRWAKGAWDAGFETAPDMDAELRRAIMAFADDGRRVNLIDRKAEGQGTHRLYLFPEGLTILSARADIAAILTRAFAGDLDGWSAVTDKLILVCTHGQRDRCCAAKGFALYRALRDRATQGPEIWESTHLGGCRFAGGALVLPQMHKYGRLTADTARDLVNAAQEGHLLLDHWRGPCDLEPDAQAAAVVAAPVLGGQVESVLPVSEGLWRVTGGGADVVSRTEFRATDRPGNCAALDAGESVAYPGYVAHVVKG